MGTEALKTIKTEGMTAKHFISVLTLVLLGTLTYGQKIEYSTDQLRECLHAGILQYGFTLRWKPKF